MAKKPVSIGDRVKDFTLESSRGGKVNTATFKGKKILLSFYPSAWSLVSAKQMQAIDAAYAEFEKLNTIPLGISVDSPTSLAAWARSLKLTRFHLLADFWPHGETAKKLGVFIKKAGVSARVNIILGKKRKVIFCRVYSSSQAPDVKELIEFLKKKIIQDAKDSAKEQEKKPEPAKHGTGKPVVKKPAAGKITVNKPKEVKPASTPAEKPIVVPEEKPADSTADKPTENPPDKPPETQV